MAGKTGEVEYPRLCDPYRRSIHYLRVSVTDRCNLRCLYCHPPYEIRHLRRKELCTFEELLTVISLAARLGVDKVRLTGGEPLLRQGIMGFISRVTKIQGIRQVSLTTNGTLLHPYLRPLKEAGIQGLNISLDTLSESRFYELSGGHGLCAVLKSIETAVEIGFRVKINMVVLRGMNDHEMPGMIDRFLGSGTEVRFIEFMPLCGPGWKKEYFVSYQEMKTALERRFDLRPLPSSGSAREFALRKGNGIVGKIGIVAAWTRPFCLSCSRLRLSARGELRPCLFSPSSIDLLPILRQGLPVEERDSRILACFEEAVQSKPRVRPENCHDTGVHIGEIGG